ncbi:MULTISPECIES: CBS domain-containing protein [Xanthomonas translucens group]|uniref:CBS domain-containing protein n=1 Tax=Xanthomonas cerealis pv. cerealis TaxID=152263 RepID=A0A514E9U7_9XANT|nr:CBS domain-containing protein [Xanthomonas translucens]QDI02811.1 CBS domain-containing protein [Xanthomonas translucens pv. cerealis]UKE48198.1 CBS domain-containing protein [Xanthomonas translucens pv. cerealis]UKE70606.1 CBS domain-containing protein [Xanthomonas translucens pv. pistacia]
MRTVRQLLCDKGGEVHAVAPDAAVVDALRLMADKGIGAVLVMQDGRLAGILSERDYARKVVLQDRSSATTPVRDIMSAKVYTVDPSQSVQQCMELMTGQRIRHLPVVQAGAVVGVISIGDLVKAVIEEQQRELDQLQRYITS